MAEKAKLLDNAIESAIRNAIVDYKVNACPMAVRLAWHASGTFDKSDGSGGSNGATMRFPLEAGDPANNGLNIMRDLLIPVKNQFPFLSYADIWTRAGAFAVRFTGGATVPFNYGRTDATDPSVQPPNGRLPDASQGAQHLRDVFNRMGFDDREIVCLSGAHTLGRCHKSRSGYDGPWTANPLSFDNSYFVNLMTLDWKPRVWDGPLQYEDPSGKYMMLPTDMALKTDPAFRVFAQRYADDEQLFFKDFAAVRACVRACLRACVRGARHDDRATPHHTTPRRTTTTTTGLRQADVPRLPRQRGAGQLGPDQGASGADGRRGVPRARDARVPRAHAAGRCARRR
jgi:catalase (peroxidase I)